MNYGLICATHQEAKAVFNELDRMPHYRVGEFGFYELKGRKNKVIISISGVGCVRAARCCATLIQKYHINHIINFGTCGAVNPKLESGCIVIPNQLVFIGKYNQIAARAKISNKATEVFRIYSQLGGLDSCNGTLATCSSFVHSDEKQKIEVMGIDVVDMEAFALNFTCSNKAVLLSIYKVIVDSVQSKIDFIDDYLQLESSILERSADKIRELISIHLDLYNDLANDEE